MAQADDDLVASTRADLAAALLHLAEPFGHSGTDRLKRLQTAALRGIGIGDRPLRRLPLFGHAAKIGLDPPIGLLVRSTRVGSTSSVVDHFRPRCLALFSYMYQ